MADASVMCPFPHAPRVGVEVVDCWRDGGMWRVSWEVSNQGEVPLALQSAWIPHGRFRGPGRMALSEALPPGGRTRLEVPVAAVESPGTIVENAFLILRMLQAGAPWQLFARMRIEFDAQAAPRPVVEEITAQAVGRAYD